MRLLPQVFRAALSALALPALVSAQQATPQQPMQHNMRHPVQLTEADYARAERFMGAGVASLVSGAGSAFTWLEDGRLVYRVALTGGPETRIVDPARNQSRVCVPATDPCTPPQPARPANAPPGNSSISPDRTKAAFIRNYNLWVKDLVSGAETQLTTDGVEDFGYATNNAGWTHGDSPVLSWSPDSKQIATFQHDGRGVSMMYLTSTNVGAPRLQAWRYPLPGDSVIFRVQRVVIALDGGDGRPKVTRLQMPADQHRSRVSDHIACGMDVCDLEWFPDGSKIAFVSNSRDHKKIWMRVADARTGAVQTLYEETSETQIGDASLDDDLWQVLPATNELIQWSVRNGWVHLYLFDLNTGALKNRITTGNGNVTRILRIDERARRIYFMAQGRESDRDPYFQSAYRVNFDGRSLIGLTPEVGNHTVQLSPDGRWIVDTYSQPNVPPVTVLRDGNTGRVVRELARVDISRLTATGWKAPQPFTVKARDGQTDLYGLMFTPTQLDSTKKYPIINYIYPGPQGGSVGSRSFSPARGDHQALAELGFVVVMIDGMGSSPQRSKAFHDAYYGRMGDNTIPDQVAGMQELARRHRFIDIDKAGMWGHSGGGFATAAALLRAPEFFKVGIAESGNHDNRNYEDDWGERYQGLLTRNGNTDNYTAEANQTYAANLRGKLLLIHGMMDDNVPASNTMLVADALMKANKDFDMILLPHARHGFGQDGQYIMRRRWDYFVTHLQGNIPPKEYRMGQRR